MIANIGAAEFFATIISEICGTIKLIDIEPFIIAKNTVNTSPGRISPDLIRVEPNLQTICFIDYQNLANYVDSLNVVLFLTNNN